MKNNNSLLKVSPKNNANVSFLSKNRNMVVIGIIVVFLIIIGVYLYRTYSSEQENNVSLTNQLVDLSSAPVFSQIVEMENQRESCGNKEPMPDDPGNVKLLNNVRDRTVEDEIESKKQVFNISNNIFSYKDARAACKAHGADLATYHQVLDSYKKGGEWCNYGWSEGQMALYPTQKETWEELQKDPESAGTCGNWGVNGGYFDNPDTLFGANCYGLKPKPKDREKEKKLAFTKNQKVMLDKINMYKSQMNELTVKPFNKDIWSEKGKMD